MKIFGLAWVAICSFFLAGCAGPGEGAAYLSLSDRAMVTGAGRGEWSGPHRFSVEAEPEGEMDFIGGAGGAGGYSVFQGGGGEVWMKGDRGMDAWLRFDGQGGSELLKVIKRRGRVEILGVGLREFMGLGGLGA